MGSGERGQVQFFFFLRLVGSKPASCNMYPESLLDRHVTESRILRRIEMKQLTHEEVANVAGGNVVRWIVESVASWAAEQVITAAVNEKHTAGDSCDYYESLPPGVQ